MLQIHLQMNWQQHEKIKHKHIYKQLKTKMEIAKEVTQ